MKKILIINSNPFHNGPRMIREIEALKNQFEIFAIGRTKPHDPSIYFYNVDKIYILTRIVARLKSFLLRKPYSGKAILFLGRFHKLLDSINPDIVIVHNPVFFPAIFNYKKKKFKVVYNAHEYHPLQHEDNALWLKTPGAYYYKLYQEYLSKVDLMVNVCDSIAKKCFQEFGKESIVIPNAAIYHNTLSPQLKKVGQPIKIIHHGAAIRGRKLETMINAVGKYGGDFHMDLMLIPLDKKYYRELFLLTKKYNNVNIIQPVGFKEIVSFIHQYDVGMYILNPGSFNNEAALPNKIFEFIQARLALLVSPNTEIKQIVEQYRVGMVTKGYSTDDLMECIQEFNHDKINEWKSNSHRAAEPLAAETYYERFINKIEAL